MKIYSNEVDKILLSLGGSVPVIGLKAYTKGEPEHYAPIRGRVDGAIMTAGLSPDEFRKLALTLLKIGKAELVDGLFKLKTIKLNQLDPELIFRLKTDKKE